MELNEEVLTDKIQLAVLHFKAKNYAKSLSLYNEIVHSISDLASQELLKIRKFYKLSPLPVVGILSHPKLAIVLDQRAATFEKLGNDLKALNDAQKIITIDPVNCKGYLRMGKLYLKAGKQIEAYKIYQKGIYIMEKAVEKHKIAISEKLLTSLKVQYKDLNQTLKEQREKKAKSSHVLSSEVSKAKSFSSASLQSRLDDFLPLKRSKSLTEQPTKKKKRTGDILYRFPRDVVELIFSYMPFRSLLKCHLVCKDWYNELTTMPKLYRNNFVLKSMVTAPEYFHGLRVMKKVLLFLHTKSIGQVRLRSTYNLIHLGRILENILSDETLNIQKLDVINRDLSFELFLNKLEKCKWKPSLREISSLSFGFNSSIQKPALLLLLFPLLQSLDIVLVDKLLNGTNAHLVPKDSSNLTQLMTQLQNLESYNTLESLSLLNHPGLTREHLRVRPSEKTFNSRPPFLQLRFPFLKKLTLASFDFTDLESQFGTFLANVPHLSELYLENNEELCLKQFMMIIRRTSPDFQLKKLTIREKPQNRACSLTELDIDSLPSLFELSYLDLYGCSLSSRGFLKLLKIANSGWNLSTLNVGNCHHIYFKTDKFVTGHEVLTFSQMFELAPGLQQLYMNELDLDNLSMKLFHKDLIKVTGYDNCPLKKLDLSFCRLIDGIGLINLINPSHNPLKLEELVLDGLEINKETTNMLTRREIVSVIRNDPFKKKWRQYGVNSLVPEIS